MDAPGPGRAARALHLDDVREALRGYAPAPFPAFPGRPAPRDAAVLVPVVGEARPRVVVTLRPRGMARHAGEICFPGGRPEASDADLWATAVREAEEELGLAVVARLGQLTSLPLFGSDYRMQPFVAHVAEAPWRPHPGEVAAVYELDLDEAVRREVVPGIPYELHGEERLAPYFDLGDGVVMYGATALGFWELVTRVAAHVGAPGPRLARGDRGWKDIMPR
ncbi:MAG: CoA pyrophosphatase [Deltaproteobacteria bacterium]|nr:CoA pyrophosphatase [Deltaproteobacteria bacterium]